MIEVRPFTADRTDIWNGFNAAAGNGHFLFDRGFMDYHADRFSDASLMLFADGALAGVLPANRNGQHVHSHQGLTFGGLVTRRASTPCTMAMLDACREWYSAAGASRWTYKALPPLYHDSPAEADRYWLTRNDAVLVRRDVTTAIDYRALPACSARRKRGVRRAARAGLRYGVSQQWGRFWTILAQVLGSRHGVNPVHSLAEITSLAARFPNRIGLYTAETAAGMLAGVVMFATPHVAHAQYIAASDEGKACGALDGLLDWLIERHRPTHRSFDFGISTFDDGRRLNTGLLTHKEEFGGGAVLHDTYELKL